MLVRWPIRAKVLVGLGLLLTLVAILSSSGLYATYAYRTLVKSLSCRVGELPLAAELNTHVSDMRLTLSRMDRMSSWKAGVEKFHKQRVQFDETLAEYVNQLDTKPAADWRMADDRPEREIVEKIQAALGRLDKADRRLSAASRKNAHLVQLFGNAPLEEMDGPLEELQTLCAELPNHLQETLRGLAVDVRGQYRTLIIGTWITAVSATLVFALFLRLFYRWIFVPLGVLIRGSRRVAAGAFDYRIRLETHDEMSELAGAMNDMTARFQAIRDDLDGQVRERTKQVLRSEQLASVGFLAAGVAHEINNPLASIAMCAESLEGRIREVLEAEKGLAPDDSRAEVIGRYLRMIQSEAFRCKEITEKLLDFSRIGPSERQDTELRELVAGVIDMLGHLGRYHGKRIEFGAGPPLVAPVNSREIKQVVLNLLTNALDSVAADGLVRIRLEGRDGMAELSVTDNGCGMEPEVLERVFEPFFTRRRAGQGTGLGLSIAYRIAADHGGGIEAQSAGPGRGATFRVRLPLGSAAAEAAAERHAA